VEADAGRGGLQEWREGLWRARSALGRWALLQVGTVYSRRAGSFLSIQSLFPVTAVYSCHLLGQPCDGVSRIVLRGHVDVQIVGTHLVEGGEGGLGKKGRRHGGQAQGSAKGHVVCVGGKVEGRAAWPAAQREPTPKK
jgi:hypothetical protein